jgi:AraC-like DNA-binding protein
MKYLLDTRLHFARALLLQTDETVSGIAERCGFNTSSYFIKCFRERYFESPLSYKRAMLEKSAQQI